MSTAAWYSGDDSSISLPQSLDPRAVARPHPPGAAREGAARRGAVGGRVGHGRHLAEKFLVLGGVLRRDAGVVEAPVGRQERQEAGDGRLVLGAGGGREPLRLG